MPFVLVAAVILFLLWRRRNRDGSTEIDRLGAVGWLPSTRWQVVRPLARVDVRRVLLHPAFVAGVVITPLMLLPATEYATTWREASAGIALALVPLGWLTIIATNLVALRSRRTGADELFGTLPAPQPVRTTALLATVVGPVIVATLLAAAWVVYLGIAGSRAGGLIGSPDWKEVGAGVLIVAGSVSVGVSIARYLHHAGFGVLGAIATMILNVRFLDVTTWPWTRADGDPLRFLAFIGPESNSGLEFLEVRPAGWHALYLAGLVVVMAGVALARDGLRRPIGVVLGAGLVVAGGAGWMQTRPPSDERALAMVAHLTDPEAHQVCEVSNGVRYCAYEEFVDDIAEWRDVVETTMARLPAGAGDGAALTVSQRAPIIVGDDDCTPMPFEDSLPPTVADRISPAAVWAADAHVHPGFREESFPCSDRDAHGFFLAVQTGARAVGLPATPRGEYQRCTASGQARAAIALWAAAAARPDGEATLRDVMVEGSVGGPRITFDGWDAPPMWGVVYGVVEAELALAMVGLDTGRVRAALDHEWQRWIDPSTPSADLGRALGIERGAEAAVESSTSCS